MKFLPLAVVFALVVFSSAVPVKKDEDASDEVSLDDLNEAVRSLDVLEATASESQLYFLKKIKRAIKRGIKVDVRIRPASAALDRGTGLSVEEFQGLADAYENLNKLTVDDGSYFFKKIRKGLKKVGRIIEKGAKKALEHGVSFNVPF